MELALCVGAEVMLTCNLNPEDGLVNGSRGTIVDIDPLPVVQFYAHTTPITIHPHAFSQTVKNTGSLTVTQIPLRLAWAITIHKSQGMSLDCAEIDIGSNVFEYGQAYVALSRMRSMEGLRLAAFDPTAVRAHPEVLKYYAHDDRSIAHENNK